MVLGAFACVLFLGGTFRRDRRFWGAAALVGLAGAAAALFLTRLPRFETPEAAQAALYASPVWLDRLSILIKAIALAGGGLLVLFSWDEVDDDHAAEYHGCLLLITAGICFTAGANDLITLFLAL